jgi:hypothetical protein
LPCEGYSGATSTQTRPGPRSPPILKPWPRLTKTLHLQAMSACVPEQRSRLNKWLGCVGAVRMSRGTRTHERTHAHTHARMRACTHACTSRGTPRVSGRVSGTRVCETPGLFRDSARAIVRRPGADYARTHAWHHTAPHRTAPNRTTPHRTAPHTARVRACCMCPPCTVNGSGSDSNSGSGDSDCMIKRRAVSFWKL